MNNSRKHLHGLSRRDFLRLSGVTTAGVLIAACAPAGEAPAPAPVATTASTVAEPAAPAVAGQKYKEAPQLAELVRAGQLPPVDERLPKNPVVVEPLHEIGRYGGEWRGGTTETNGNFFIRNGGYEQLVRWTPEWDGILPNVAESYESNDEGSEYTFHLREGIRYSDGAPLTADDIMFWYEDVFLDGELTPVKPAWLTRNDQAVVVEKIDDYTVKFSFAGPNGLFLKNAAQTNTEITTRYPRHYLEQFHAKYNPNVDQLVKEAGQDSWIGLFELKSTPHQNADLPRLWPWLPTTNIADAPGGRVVCVRNPYYWKVDPEGHQLPYMDRYIVEIVSSVEVLVLKALNGELDYQERFISAPTNKAVLFDNMEAGKYHFYDLYPTTVNEMIIQFNQTTTDPVLREVFQNKDFRIGMSYAIDRQEVIDVVHVSQGEAWQASPRPESRFHHERLAKQYTEYNPELANEHLDKAGYTQRDAAGFRLGPDGKRISFIMEIDASRVTYIDALELILTHWEAVGVEMIVKTMDRSLWEERCRSNNTDFHASAHRFGGGSGDAVILDARYYLPIDSGNSMYAKGWAFWYNNPENPNAVEPPAEVKRAMELYDRIPLISSDDEQFDLMMQVLDIAADQFYCVGTVLEPNAFGVVTNRMRNTPALLPNSWIYPTPGPYNPAQFWVDDA
jgi:peptide/nickel transport system substrate-binding protein